MKKYKFCIMSILLLFPYQSMNAFLSKDNWNKFFKHVAVPIVMGSICGFASSELEGREGSSDITTHALDSFAVGLFAISGGGTNSWFPFFNKNQQISLSTSSFFATTYFVSRVWRLNKKRKKSIFKFYK